MKTALKTLALAVFAVLALIAAGVVTPAHASLEVEASRGPASDDMDPVTKALYQSLDEQARSRQDFESNEAAGRPKDTSSKKQLRIELGDELGSGFGAAPRSRFAVRKQRTDNDIPSIESKLDEESREVRSQVRENKREQGRKSRHWIDQ